MAKTHLYIIAALLTLSACNRSIQNDFADDKAICTQIADEKFRKSKMGFLDSRLGDQQQKRQDTKELLFYFYECMNSQGWQVAVPELDEDEEDEKKSKKLKKLEDTSSNELGRDININISINNGADKPTHTETVRVAEAD